MQTFRVVGKIKSYNAQCECYYTQADNASKEVRARNYERAKERIRAKFKEDGFEKNPTFERFFELQS